MSVEKVIEVRLGLSGQWARRDQVRFKKIRVLKKMALKIFFYTRLMG